MDNFQIGLLTTFILGIFIIIGSLFALLISKKSKIVDFSIGLAFGVIVALIITDLLPELLESLGFRYLHILIVFTLIGFFLLKLLDHFVPDHHEDHMSKKEENENLTHIGIITTFTLVLHNIVEGIAVYSTAISNPSLAIGLSIGVGFHNIPLGIVVASSFYHSNQSMMKTIVSIAFVSLSTFFGGLLMYSFHLTNLSEFVLGILLSLTLGMLLFIVIDELVPRIHHMKKKKIAYFGIISGVVILLLALFIG